MCTHRPAEIVLLCCKSMLLFVQLSMCVHTVQYSALFLRLKAHLPPMSSSSDHSQHSEKAKCSASSNLDWQAYLYYWLSYVSLQKRQVGFWYWWMSSQRLATLQRLPRLISAETSRSWCRKTWLPNYLPIHFCNSLCSVKTACTLWWELTKLLVLN